MGKPIPWDIIITVIVSVLGSSGFWAFLQNRQMRHSADRRLLTGLAHGRIIYLASKYIRVGGITQEDYEDLYKYLFEPYCAAGGNGSAARLMKKVDQLPIVTRTEYEILERKRESQSIDDLYNYRSTTNTDNNSIDNLITNNGLGKNRDN